MIKILVSEKVSKLLETKFRSQAKEILKIFKKLEKNPIIGDYVFGTRNIDCREVKLKGLRIFTVQYRDKVYIELDDEFLNAIKIVDIARKNKAKEQQDMINDIKKRLEQFGIKI